MGELNLEYAAGGVIWSTPLANIYCMILQRSLFISQNIQHNNFRRCRKNIQTVEKVRIRQPC